MNDQLVLAEQRGNYCWVSINRPEALNALNLETLNALNKVFQEWNGQDGLHGFVLTGAGEKAFVAGADIKAIAELDDNTAMGFAHAGHECMNTIEQSRYPVIAAVNGYCLGGGMELALAADFIYASEKSLFGLPEVSLGIFPGWGGTQRLARLIGSNRAKELIFTGRKLSAKQACSWGFVNKVSADADFNSDLEVLLSQLSKQGPAAVSLAKRAINQGAHLNLDEALSKEREIFTECFKTEDAKEGLAAFVEKRKPEFKGK